MRAVVLGGGIVGAVIAADLAFPDPLADSLARAGAGDAWDVTVLDADAAACRRAERLGRGRVRTRTLDLSAPGSIRDAVAEADIVLGALPGALGLRALREVIEAGKPCCDISFMPEDARLLDALARERGVTAIVDAGVAPGLSNLLCAHGLTFLTRCDQITILVGGLPRRPQPPFEYKAAFSPSDVIEEYVRPARYVTGGRIVTAEALSAVEIVELPGMPPLEAFLTDGLRSLADTLPAPEMQEKTLRYPGHARLMRALREAGLFRSEPVEVGGTTVRPLDVTTAGLFPLWQYEEGEEDVTVMRVEIRGVRGDREATFTWDLLDFADLDRGFSSMARTTAFPCALLARELMGRRESPDALRPGVIMPEELGADVGLFARVLAGLAARGVEARLC